jgi:cytochrome P450
MFIPKGTVCVGNIWHCNHDRAVFGEDADEFRPERHLDESGDLLSGSMETVQAGHVTFGFGRRVCVGKYLAIDTRFITTARMLRAAKLERVRDESGKEVGTAGLGHTHANRPSRVSTRFIGGFFPHLTNWNAATLLHTTVWSLPVSRR